MTHANKLFSELAIGESASITRVVTPDDLYVFARVSGNLNPAHLPASRGEAGPVPAAPSMWVGSLFSAVLGNLLPGPGTLYRVQTLHFFGRAHVGATLTVSVRVKELRPPDIVVLDTRIQRGDELICDGIAEVVAPPTRQIVDEATLPQLMVARHRHVERLMTACTKLPGMPTAVVAPEEETALMGALAGARANLIAPILLGDTRKMRSLAAEHGVDLSGCTIEDLPSHDAAAARAVELVHQGTVTAIMKGHLHTDELLRHVMKSQGGLRIGRRISHVFVMDAPSLPGLLLVTDAAINIAPTLEDKVDIVQNAIDLGVALGIRKPKVGILSAVETVNPKIPSTLDAAILSKMSDRGQIRGGIVDGPLAMDNAISLAAARTKGLTSLVAGVADILVVPNLEAGNILAKELTYAAQAEGAGLVLGAKVPVLLTSRADDETARLFSCAVAVLYAHWQATGESGVPPVGTAEALS
ncbi:MAG TPA: bifunctional enoyl-CoA hydratase/phosphate acetyltransferase [Acetobacteraceae bacterium]|nr:bifunctional enoyl-CoA hydratase/phosphate acetyltransferase [Acetobacteraceae bacterium]